MRIFLWLSVLLAFFVAAPAVAQGTPEQQAACENDAFRFCDALVPNAIAVERCLRANMGALSPACRAEFGVATPPQRRSKKR